MDLFESRVEVSRRGVLIGALAGAAGVVLAGCAGDPEPDEAGSAVDGDGAAGAVTVAPDGTQEITLLVEDDYVFLPAAFTVAPGAVRLTLTSVAEQLTHNIRFTPGGGPVDIAEEVPIVVPGDTETIEFTVEQPGDYQYECSFHVALGQIGTMTVSAA